MTTLSFLTGHKPGTRPRVYCPVCGQVRGSEQYSRGLVPVVHAHHRNTGDAETVLCPGGPVDMDKDKAT